MGSGVGKKKATRQYKNIQAIILSADYSTRPGLGIRMWVRVLSGKYPPRSCFQASYCPFQSGFGGEIRVKLCLTTKHSPDPPGCYRKPDYSTRFCPSSSALLWSQFSVRSSAESPADDWLPGAPHWHLSLIPPSNRNWAWTMRAGPPCVHTGGR